MTQEEFERLLQEVDAKLQKKHVPIHARELQAMAEISKRLNITLPVAPIFGGPIPGNYEGESLSAHISAWFNNRYGDRQKMDFAIGYSLVLLRGDAWLLRFPTIYGHVKIVCERDLSKQYKNMVVNRAGRPHQDLIVNLLNLIEKLPQGLAKQLSDGELQQLIAYYVTGHKFYNAVASFCKGSELAETAVTDLKASAHAAIDNVHNYGQSLWSSLQAAEKMLKFFIASKGKNFPQIHVLSKLAEQAYGLGLPPIDEELIKCVQCTASVRYEQGKYSIQKVVEAHQGALHIASLVTGSMFPAANPQDRVANQPIKPQVAIAAPTSNETIFKPGHFYRSPTLGHSYLCVDITDDLATIILVESYQHGHLFQAVFKQKLEYQGVYMEITDEEEIARLKHVGDKVIRANRGKDKDKGSALEP